MAKQATPEQTVLISTLRNAMRGLSVTGSTPLNVVRANIVSVCELVCTQSPTNQNACDVAKRIVERAKAESRPFVAVPRGDLAVLLAALPEQTTAPLTNPAA
jgi:hypothetical protein